MLKPTSLRLQEKIAWEKTFDLKRDIFVIKLHSQEQLKMRRSAVVRQNFLSSGRPQLFLVLKVSTESMVLYKKLNHVKKITQVVESGQLFRE